MRKNTTTDHPAAAIPEWRQARIEMARLVWENILDPIMTFNELVREYGNGGIDFNPEEITAVLRLIVLGGYTETKLYCTFGGSLPHVSGDHLEEEIRNWDRSTEGGAA